MGASPKELSHISLDSQRRFGVELEINAFDGRNRPEPPKKRPEGTEHVAMIVSACAEEGADIKEWEHTAENNKWVVKPDSSCGLEICTPPLKGWRGIQKVVNVVEAFAEDPKIKVDKRCSVHVHVEVADLTEEQIASIVAAWIKCEPVFLDMVPPERKKNRYCQMLTMTNLLQHDEIMSPRDLIYRVGDVKYYSLNCHQMRRTNMQRKTMEFRIIEGAGCKDPYLIKNWIRLLLHFVETTCHNPPLKPYSPDDPWSSYCWLDTEDVMRMLGFSDNPRQHELSRGLTQTRNWMLARLATHMTKDVDRGPRWRAYKELQGILERYKAAGTPIDPREHLLPADIKSALYDENTRF